MRVQFNPMVINVPKFNPAMQRMQYAKPALQQCDSVSFSGSTTGSKGKKSITDLKDSDLKGKKVLVRADFNVPLENGKISNDTRIRATIPTINHLTDKGAKVIIVSHFEDKAGDENILRSLDIVAERLSELLNKDVQFCYETTGPIAKSRVDNLKRGDILLLENTRYNEGEKKNDPAFVAALADLADVYVNDAFGTAHRKHASTAGVAEVMSKRGKPSVMGLLMGKEVNSLGQILDNPERPLTTIIGGKKVSDKVKIVDNLLNNTLKAGDNMIICGAMAHAFSKAKGGEIGNSYCPDDAIELAKEIAQKAQEKGVNLVLPKDTIATDDFSGNGIIKVADLMNIESGFAGVDAGPVACKEFADVILNSRTILWNGPAGVFENDKFSKGTEAIAIAMTEATKNGATTVVGGGDSVSAINKFKISEDLFTHISTGGGASMEFLEGKQLPGVAALDEK